MFKVAMASVPFPSFPLPSFPGIKISLSEEQHHVLEALTKASGALYELWLEPLSDQTKFHIMGKFLALTKMTFEQVQTLFRPYVPTDITFNEKQKKQLKHIFGHYSSYKNCLENNYIFTTTDVVTIMTIIFLLSLTNKRPQVRELFLLKRDHEIIRHLVGDDLRRHYSSTPLYM